MTQPTEDTPEQSAGTGPRRRVRPWVWVAAGLAVIVGALVVVLVATSDPAPISRTELMRQYAEIAPNDRSATPEVMDKLAETACEALTLGHSTDEVITAANPQFGANATRVMMLVVEYKCPERLGEFK